MAPYKLSKESSFNVQCILLTATVPIIIWGVYVFGTRVITLVLTSVLFSILTYISFYAISKNLNQFSPIKPMSLGILSALILPVASPLWIAALGGFIATTVTLISFRNKIYSTFINPIAASGLILYGLFGTVVNRFTAPFNTFSATNFSTPNVDKVTSILESIKSGTDSITTSTLLNIFLGRNSGAIGEISVFLILISAIYMVYKKYISYHISLSFIASVFLLSFFLPKGNCEAIFSATAETLSGGVIFYSIFIAPLPASAPITTSGKIIFGLGCGIITFILRRSCGITDGTLLAVGIMSCFSNVIDILTGNKYFSYLTDKRKEKEPHKTNLEALLND